MNAVIKYHDQLYEKHPILHHDDDPPIIREKSFSRRQTLKEKQIERNVQNILKSYDKNYGNILQQLNKTWPTSGMKPKSIKHILV